MVEVRAATDAEGAVWLEGWRERLRRWYGQHDVDDEWVSRQAEQRASRHLGAERFVFVLTTEGGDVGFLAAARTGAAPATTSISDLWVAPERRRRGYGAAALRWAETWAAPNSTKLTMLTDAASPALAGLVTRYPLRAELMIKRVSNVDSLPGGVAGRGMTDEEVVPWLEGQQQEYADEMVASGLLRPSEASIRARTQYGELLPDGPHTANHTFWALMAGVDHVATVWLGHHDQPKASWVHKVEVGAAHRGQGYGRAAMVLAEQATANNADTHLALNVFAHNTVAINLYHSLGYDPVDQYRSRDLTG